MKKIILLIFSVLAISATAQTTKKFQWVKVDPIAYGASWDGNYKVPTLDALYDKIETISSATPGGSTGQFQYNSSGSFGGTEDMTYDGTHFSIDDGSYLKFLNSSGAVLFQLYGSGKNIARLNSPNNYGFSITGSSNTYAQFSSTEQSLYYSGTKRFETTSYGVNIPGVANVTDSLLIPLRAYNSTTFNNSTRAVSEDTFRDKMESLTHIYSVKVSINNADLKSAYETPIIIISAPGSGKIIAIDVYLSYVRVNYASSAMTATPVYLYADGVSDYTITAQALVTDNAISTASTLISSLWPVNILGLESAKDNVAIKLKPGADITTGGGSIDLYIAYRIITL
jgi:hypothetical protein